MKAEKLILEIAENSYELISDQSSEICKKVIKKLPLAGDVVNVQGEIFFTVNIDISYPISDAREIFDIGDVVYWKSPDGSMAAIALFYGNTVYIDGKKPRAYSPCIKIASLKNIKPEEYTDIENNVYIRLYMK
ncbi:MAG TPA: cyclophilin-like family protein [Victivallales bacterium]|nr:cyclophilin-like family protein [Victivallales bacterium]